MPVAWISGSSSVPSPPHPSCRQLCGNQEHVCGSTRRIGRRRPQWPALGCWGLLRSASSGTRSPFAPARWCVPARTPTRPLRGRLLLSWTAPLASLHPTSLARPSWGVGKMETSGLFLLILCVSPSSMVLIPYRVVCLNLSPAPAHTTGGHRSSDSSTRVISRSFYPATPSEYLAHAQCPIDG